MNWPRATSPAWPVHAGFAGAVLVFGIGYGTAGPGSRMVVFAAATAVPPCSGCARPARCGGG